MLTTHHAPQFFTVLLTYTVPNDRIDTLRPVHLEFLKRYFDQ